MTCKNSTVLRQTVGTNMVSVSNGAPNLCMKYKENK